MKNYYAIGTIVELKNVENRLYMIIGHYVEDEKLGERDYVATRYPLGVVGRAHYYYFNNEDIQSVLFEGYVNKEHQDYVSLINESIKMNNKNHK